MYVDDILITASDQESINTLIHNLNKPFALKDLGQINYFLGIQFSTLRDGKYPSLSKEIYQ